MGTNYYAVRTRPTTDEPIHIGKASLGWKFLFQAMDEKYNEPPVVWNTYDQVYEWSKTTRMISRMPETSMDTDLPMDGFVRREVTT